MKTIKYLIFSLMAAFAVGCSGNVDDVEELEDLVLYADVDEIIADGSSAVSFTVMYGDEESGTPVSSNMLPRPTIAATASVRTIRP